MNKDTKVVIIVGICCCLIILGIFGLTRLNKSTQEESSNQSSSVETSYEDNGTDNIDYANSNNEESIPELLDENDFNNSQSNSSEENSMESSSTEETSNKDNNDDNAPEQVEQTDTDDTVSNDSSSTYDMDNYYCDTGEDISVDLTKYTPYYIDDKRYYIDNDVFKQYTESILIDYANNIKDTEVYTKILDITKSEDIVISESYYDEYGYHALMNNDEYYFYCDIKYDGSYEVTYCDSENNYLDSLSGSYIDKDSYDNIAMKSLLRK